MAFVQFSNLSLAFGGRDILKNTSFHLDSGSHSCLTGANGSGKSTLMKIIAGIITPDTCDSNIQKGACISYLPQWGIVHSGKKLREEAEAAFGFAHNIISLLEKNENLLEKAGNDEKLVKSLLKENMSLHERLEDSGYYRRESVINAVFTGLGFSAQDLYRDTGEFSSGWQMRIALAKILLKKPDILLLDEPTNYLDIEARNWLEDWLETFPGGYLLVSHDRYFLDVSVNEVYEIFQGKLKRYAGNYSSYEKTRKSELESLIKQHNEQQEEIAKTESLIRRFRYKASKAAFAQELIKRLEKTERIEIPESLKKININFPPAPHSGKVAITLEGICKNYGERKVLSSLDILIESGERLVVAGPNGAGKTTLLRIIAGADNNFTGNVKYGAGVSAGYFSQDAAEAMCGSEQVIEYLEKEAPAAFMPKLRDMLGSFLFRGDDVYKSVSVLSGGEKSRLALLKMFLKPFNLLVLDEPTNHLDLNSKDILLDALSKFNGTIIFVSHDRYFMETLSTKTLELSPGIELSPARARLFYGNYSYYLDRAASEGAGENEKVKPVKQKSSSETRAADKQKQTHLRKLDRQEAEILKTIEELESLKSKLEAELSLPEVYGNREKAREVKLKIDECTEVIEKKTIEWEQINRELEFGSWD
jgi:ATP-binding cassette subfamily F protein 3